MLTHKDIVSYAFSLATSESVETEGKMRILGLLLLSLSLLDVSFSSHCPHCSAQFAHAPPPKSLDALMCLLPCLLRSLSQAKLDLTGGTATGYKIGEAAGKHAKHFTAELGGNAPVLVRRSHCPWRCPWRCHVAPLGYFISPYINYQRICVVRAHVHALSLPARFFFFYC